MAKNVFMGFVTACRLAGRPVSLSPSSVKATMEGVVLAPSAFSRTLGLVPSMTATHELVVPRSMPMTLAISSILSFAADRSSPKPGPRLPEVPKRPAGKDPLGLGWVWRLYSGRGNGLQRAHRKSDARRRINAVDWMWKGHGVEGCNHGLAGFRHLPGYLGRQQQRALATQMAAVAAAAPFYRPTMPRTGKPLSVRMTNCGALGWVSDREGGYRYQATHPVTGNPWPAMPEMLLAIWADVAGYGRPPPACLLHPFGAPAPPGSPPPPDQDSTRT